jgi:thioredoxin-like negative regulator of GroEL
VVAYLQARVAAETNRNQLLQQKLAEAWARAGQLEKAGNLYGEMIKTRPFDRSAISAQARLLAQRGRDDEALALLREMKGVQTLRDEIEARFQVIETLVRLERADAAEKELEELLAWAKGGPTLERAAHIFRSLKNWAKAAELYEQSRTVARGWNYNQLLFALGQCYAKLGRPDEALKTWEASGGSRYSGGGFEDEQVTAWLASEGLHELALKFAQSRLAKNPENWSASVTLAHAQLGLGKTNEAFAAFERAAQAPKFEPRSELRDGLSQFIAEHELLVAAWERQEKAPSTLLIGALIDVAARGDEKPERAKQVADHLEKLSPDDSELQLALGGALLKSQRNAAAAGQFRKALGSTNETQRLAAARSLAEAGFAVEAVPVLADCLNRRPHAFVNDISLVIAVAKTGDPSSIAKLNDVLAAGSVHEAQREFFATLIAHHRGQTNEARARLGTLSSSPKLNSTQLQTLAAICADQGLNRERTAFLKRLTSPGHLSHTRGWAASELVKASVKAGDFNEATHALADMHEWWGMEYCAETREALAEAVTTENFAAFERAMLAASRAHADQDVASNLIGLCAQIAQRAGQKASAALLAAQANLNDLEREEAAAWDDMIEQWDVAGPFRTPAAEPPPPIEYNQFGQPITRMPARLAPPALAENLVWKKTDPRRELGTIRLGPLLGINAGVSQGQCAYARTTITSPEDRAVTFALGSDDSVAVWVNDQQEHLSNEGRSLHPDQDRFCVRLKKGENQVLLRIGNLTDAWGFCLRVLSGRDGLVLAKVSAP